MLNNKLFSPKKVCDIPLRGYRHVTAILLTIHVIEIGNELPPFLQCY